MSRLIYDCRKCGARYEKPDAVTGGGYSTLRRLIEAGGFLLLDVHECSSGPRSTVHGVADLVAARESKAEPK